MYELLTDIDEIKEELINSKGSHLTIIEKYDIMNYLCDCYLNYINTSCNLDKDIETPKLTQLLSLMKQYLNIDIQYNDDLKILHLARADFERSNIYTKMDCLTKISYAKILIKLFINQNKVYENVIKHISEELSKAEMNNLNNYQKYLLNNPSPDALDSLEFINKSKNLLSSYEDRQNSIIKLIYDMKNDFDQNLSVAKSEIFEIHSALTDKLESLPLSLLSVDNFDSQPENLGECIGQLHEMHQRVRSCNDSNYEIIRESNRLTQAKVYEEELNNKNIEYENLNAQFKNVNTILEKYKEEYNVITNEKNAIEKNYAALLQKYQTLNEQLSIISNNYTLCLEQTQSLVDENNEQKKILNKTNSTMKQLQEDAEIQQKNYEYILSRNNSSWEKIESENKNLQQELSNKNNEIADLLNEKAIVDKELEHLQLQFQIILKNQERVAEYNIQEHYEHEECNQTISDLLSNIKEINQYDNSNNKLVPISNNTTNNNNKLIPIKPYELKMHLYNSVVHSAFDLGDFNKSLSYYGEQNIYRSLRNRRHDGRRYKNSVKLLKDRSIDQLIDYKNKYMALLEK